MSRLQARESERARRPRRCDATRRDATKPPAGRRRGNTLLAPSVQNPAPRHSGPAHRSQLGAIPAGSRPENANEFGPRSLNVPPPRSRRMRGRRERARPGSSRESSPPAPGRLRDSGRTSAPASSRRRGARIGPKAGSGPPAGSRGSCDWTESREGPAPVAKEDSRLDWKPLGPAPRRDASHGWACARAELHLSGRSFLSPKSLCLAPLGPTSGPGATDPSGTRRGGSC